MRSYFRTGHSVTESEDGELSTYLEHNLPTVIGNDPAPSSIWGILDLLIIKGRGLAQPNFRNSKNFKSNNGPARPLTRSRAPQRLSNQDTGRKPGKGTIL